MRLPLLCLPLLLAGCRSVEVSGRWPAQPPPPPPGPPVVYETSGGPPSSFRIPKGHLPPPGRCRIWYPNVPPGHQPPPGDCAELARRVPAGAWLVSRPTKDKKHVHVSVYDQSRPGVVVVVRVFDYQSGQFIRDQRD